MLVIIRILSTQSNKSEKITKKFFVKKVCPCGTPNKPTVQSLRCLQSLDILIIIYIYMFLICNLDYSICR
jgi:hypothetical protein